MILEEIIERAHYGERRVDIISASSHRIALAILNDSGSPFKKQMDLLRRAEKSLRSVEYSDKEPLEQWGMADEIREHLEEA